MGGRRGDVMFRGRRHGEARGVAAHAGAGAAPACKRCPARRTGERLDGCHGDCHVGRPRHGVVELLDHDFGACRRAEQQRAAGGGLVLAAADRPPCSEASSSAWHVVEHARWSMRALQRSTGNAVRSVRAPGPSKPSLIADSLRAGSCTAISRRPAPAKGAGDGANVVGCWLGAR